MSSSEKVRILIAKEEGLPLPPPHPPASPFGVAEGGKRDIPKNHEFDIKALKPLARTLFSASVALGHSLAAYKEFARLKSSDISPDGMLGGKGYVLKVKEVRAKLQNACETLSALTDTLHDEIHAPHWKPKISILDDADADDVGELIEEADDVLDDPERYGDNEVEEVESKKPTKTKQMKDRLKEEEIRDSGASQVPQGSDPETNEAAPPGKAFSPKEASAWKAPCALFRYANSSVAPCSLPGPRVDHLDRGEQTGPEGSYNTDEPPVDDDWGKTDGVGNEYNYPSWFENQLSRNSADGVWGQSNLPSDDDTHGEANDFGLGYGARGQGSEGYPTKNPDGRGVFGPQSGLPDDPGGATKDPNPGAGPYQDTLSPSDFWVNYASSELPFDGPDSVARSDYYEGDKGNQFNVSLFGQSTTPQGSPPGKDAPLTPRPSHNDEFMFADSQMPGDDSNYDYDRDVSPNTDYRMEQGEVPYIKYDYDTHNYRNDQEDLYREDYNG